MNKPENVARDSCASHCSSSAAEYAQELMDNFNFKRNVLDAVRTGNGLREAVNALPSRTVGGAVWQWLDGVQWYTRHTDRKASERAEKAKQMVVDRFRD